MYALLVFMSYGLYIAPIVLFFHLATTSRMPLSGTGETIARLTVYYGIYTGTIIGLWGCVFLLEVTDLGSLFTSLCVITLSIGIISGALKSLDRVTAEQEKYFGDLRSHNETSNPQKISENEDFSSKQATTSATRHLNEYQLPKNNDRNTIDKSFVTRNIETQSIEKCVHCNTTHKHLTARGMKRCLLCSFETRL